MSRLNHVGDSLVVGMLLVTQPAVGQEGRFAVPPPGHRHDDVESPRDDRQDDAEPPRDGEDLYSEPPPPSDDPNEADLDYDNEGDRRNWQDDRYDWAVL